MPKTDPFAKRRLDRLQRVRAVRQQRLAATLDRLRSASAGSGPSGGLQRYGYPVALGLVATAVLPAVLGLAWRRRKLLFEVALNGVGLWKLRRRYDAARAAGSGR